MTSFSRKAVSFLLGAGVAAAATLAFIQAADAQVPPDPPSRFAGQVSIDGGAAPSGAAVAAVVDGEVCATSNVFRSDGQSRYVLNVPSGCGAIGDTVSFTVSGRPADQSAPWANYQLGLVDLTVTQRVSAGVTSPSPLPPATGDSMAREDESLWAGWLYAALGAAALAFGGTAAVRRNR